MCFVSGVMDFYIPGAVSQFLQKDGNKKFNEVNSRLSNLFGSTSPNKVNIFEQL